MGSELVVTPEQLGQALAQDLANYTKEADEAVQKTIKEVADEALQAVEDSPSIQHMSGYKKRFYVKNLLSAGSDRWNHRAVIASRDYWLTHLLEKGHAAPGGGRTRAFPHWKNGQKIADTLPERITEAIENAGH